MQLGNTGIGFVNAATMRQSSFAVFEKEELVLLEKVKVLIVEAAGKGEIGIELSFNGEEMPASNEVQEMLYFYLRHNGFWVNKDILNPDYMEIFWAEKTD